MFKVSIAWYSVQTVHLSTFIDSGSISSLEKFKTSSNSWPSRRKGLSSSSTKSAQYPKYRLSIFDRIFFWTSFSEMLNGRRTSSRKVSTFSDSFSYLILFPWRAVCALMRTTTESFTLCTTMISLCGMHVPLMKHETVLVSSWFVTHGVSSNNAFGTWLHYHILISIWCCLSHWLHESSNIYRLSLNNFSPLPVKQRWLYWGIH